MTGRPSGSGPTSPDPPPTPDSGWIRVSGARQHNLKNLSLALPKNRLIVVTGVSGSGKSSLAFDTLYAEGQRRYVESLSAYARQFLERLEKPDVDAIEGLSPAIAIEQRSSAPNPRSTVATTTEIYDYLRVLYAACGQPHDPATGEPLFRQSIPQIAATLQALPEGTRIMILAPLPAAEAGPKGDLRPLLTRLQKAGFVRLRVNGTVSEMESLTAEQASGEEPWRFSPATPPSVEIVIDRLAIRPDGIDRLIDSVRTALRWSRDEVWVLIDDAPRDAPPRWREQRFTTSFTNPATGFRLGELTPRHFSFNSQLGACPDCQGLGVQLEIAPDLLVPDPALSLAQGALTSWWTGNPSMLAVFRQEVDALAAHFGAARDVPFEQLPAAFRDALFHGTGTTAIKTGWKTGAATRSLAKPFEGLIPQGRRLYHSSESESLKRRLARLMRGTTCPSCAGRRLRPEILAVTLHRARSVAFQATSGDDASTDPPPPEETPPAARSVAFQATSEENEKPPSQAGLTRRLEGSATDDGSTIPRFMHPVDLTDPVLGAALKKGYLLPHLTADGATYAVTFRLSGSLPASALHAWVEERDRLAREAETTSSTDIQQECARLDAQLAEKIETYLDAGHGDCWLRRPEIAQLVADALSHFEGVRYHLDAWCIMPNHVHVVVRPLAGHQLPDIVHSWKSFTANAANKLLGRSGSFWQREYYDRLIRDESEYVNQVAYVLDNPVQAGLRNWPWKGRGPRSAAFQAASGDDASTDPPPPEETPSAARSVAFQATSEENEKPASEAGLTRRLEGSATDAALSIDRFCALTVTAARAWLADIGLTDAQQLIAAEPVKEINARLQFLDNVGLGYLTLDREMGTLSGGEAQRIRLATQIGSGLSGVLYVLDEPSIGLHQRDNERLIGTLLHLRNLGNTVLVVEHDEETMRAADWLVDLGPGAGPHGGELLAAGPPASVACDPHSLTGRYLSDSRPHRSTRRHPSQLTTDHLVVHEASEHNLKNVTVRFPVGLLTCVTGVSGSGKSTLVDDILRRALARRFYHAKDTPGRHREITGLEHFDKLVVVDQDPIGRSPRSNPVTYLGVFTEIRKLFAALPASKVRGFTAGTFSFNTKGGRCEACEGDGQLRIDMHFLTDVFITCDACGGRRYQRDVLDVTYKGRSVADVLAMSFDEAAAFFRPVPQISEKLRTVGRVGLGYLHLGQGANTLSGGEAQRLKLAAELGKRATGRTLYLLDEPTTGLHFQDIEVLLDVLFRLRDAGNTLVVIEHNLDVIRAADWIIDLGPGGGEAGGQLVAEGPPEAIATCAASETGRFLRRGPPQPPATSTPAP